MLFAQIDQEEFKILCETHTNDSLAKIYEVGPRTIQHWKARLGTNVQYKVGDSRAAIAFPTNAGDDYTDQISIERERVMIIGDCEIPDHDIEMFEIVLKMAKKFGIKTLLINGDFIALDSFSKWVKSQINKVFFKQELESAHIALQVFLQTFDEIKYNSGNHELRLPHMIDGQISVGTFLNQLTGVEFSEYAHIDLRSGGRDIMVVHQKNFSVVPLSVPSRLAIARHKNVWCAHNHRLGVGRDPSGNFWIVEGGHCRNELKTHYKQLRVTCHPAWNKGAGMVIDGFPYLFDPDTAPFWLSLQPPQMGVEMKKVDKKRKEKAQKTQKTKKGQKTK